MNRITKAIFIASSCVLGAALAIVLCGAVYLFGVKRYHYIAVRPIMSFSLVRTYLFDEKFRRLVELIDEEESQWDDVFASIWDTSEGVLLSRKMFHPVEMYGEQKYMYNPGLVKLSFSLDVAGFSRAFSMVDSPALRQAMDGFHATGVYTASYDRFGFRRVDAELTEDCSVRVMFLGDSFTDGVYMDDRDTAVNRYGHVARQRGRIAVCPIDTGVDGYGSAEESFVLENYYEATGRPGVVIVMHFPNDVNVDENQVVDGTMTDASRKWAAGFTHLRRIAQFSRQHGVAAVIVAIPLAHQSANPSSRKNYQDVLRRFCEREGIRFVDLLDSLSRYDVHEIYLEGNPHWTARGHQVVAEILYEETKDMLVPSAGAAGPR